MFSNIHFGLFLILHVQTMSTFVLNECTEKPGVIMENGVARMGCTSDRWFDYCSLKSKKTFKKCTINSYAKMQPDCDEDKRIDHSGDSSSCYFTIKDIKESGMRFNFKKIRF